MKYFVAIAALMLISLTVCSAKPKPQPKPPLMRNTLTLQDRQHFLSDTFQTYRSVSAIPAPVMQLLDVPDTIPMPTHQVTRPEIAEPSQPYQESDVLSSRVLPMRRLLFVGVNKDYCILAYEHGGYSYERRAALFHLANGRATLSWVASFPGPLFNLMDAKKWVQQNLFFEADRSWL